MTCEAYLDLISGHIDAANSAREEQLLQEHLKQCPQCRALLSALTENDDVLAALPCTPPKDLTEKIMAQVRTTSQAAAPRSHRRAWVAALSAAAALTVAVFAALPALSNAQKDSASMEDMALEVADISDQCNTADAEFAYGMFSSKDGATEYDSASEPPEAQGLFLPSAEIVWGDDTNPLLLLWNDTLSLPEDADPLDNCTICEAAAKQIDGTAVYFLVSYRSLCAVLSECDRRAELYYGGLLCSDLPVLDAEEMCVLAIVTNSLE